MKLAVGADERMRIVDVTLGFLHERDFEISYYGPEEESQTFLWPEVATRVAEDVAKGIVDEGILFCWTGTGVSIAANKTPGVRAALCDDDHTAKGARLWNNANVLCISMRRTSEVVIKEILESWFSHEYIPNPSDDKCLAIVDKLDSDRLTRND